MIVLAAIFKYEYRRLLRSRLILGSLLVFVITALSAIQTGRLTVQHRLVQLDSIRSAYQTAYKKQLKLISDTSAEGKKIAATEALASLVNYRLPLTAIWYPKPLQTLSTGITDIQPMYHLVQTNINYIDPPNIPVSNPVRLFAGNFDLAFVWLYILPLLIIVCCYSLYAEEKESGTASLLALQAGRLPRVIAFKLLFRIALISVLVLFLNITGVLATPLSLQYSMSESTWWCIITQLYILMWASLCWLMISLRCNNVLTALLCTVCWLLLVIILPALNNIYISAKHPVPLRSELASLQRHESEVLWSTDPVILVDSFNAAHPQYDNSRDPAKDTLEHSTRSVAGYYYLLEKRVGQAAAALDSQINDRNQYFSRLASINPVLQTQQVYNRIAGSSLTDFRNYRQHVTEFQQQWKQFLLPWQLSGQPLGPEEFRQFPTFDTTHTAAPVSAIAGNTALYLMILLPAIGGTLLFRRQHKQ